MATAWEQLTASEPVSLCFISLCLILGAVGIAVTNCAWQTPLDSRAREDLFPVSALRLGAQDDVWLQLHPDRAVYF